MSYSPQAEPVAAACGKEVRIYGPVSPNGARRLWEVREHSTTGAARLAAQEYDDIVKRSCERKGQSGR